MRVCLCFNPVRSEAGEKLDNWALQGRSLLVSLFKCLKWIFRRAFPYTLKSPSPFKNYSSSGIFRCHFSVTL